MNVPSPTTPIPHPSADLANGAVTPTYRGHRSGLVARLNAALATELVCVLRYRRHHFLARGLAEKGEAAEFLSHADEELAHADLLAARIVQLNGTPDFSPDGLSQRSHAGYGDGLTLVAMNRENLVAERLAIDSYRATIEWLGDSDSTTRRMLEGILAVEEEHAEDMAALFALHTPSST